MSSLRFFALQLESEDVKQDKYQGRFPFSHHFRFEIPGTFRFKWKCFTHPNSEFRYGFKSQSQQHKMNVLVVLLKCSVLYLQQIRVWHPDLPPFPFVDTPAPFYYLNHRLKSNSINYFQEDNAPPKIGNGGKIPANQRNNVV